MKIKHQFVILSIIITAIPILCSLFLVIQNYISSSDKNETNTSGRRKYFESYELTHEENKEIIEALKNIPPDAEAFVVTQDNRIIFSTSLEIKVTGEQTYPEIWKIINDTGTKYFYQYSNIELKNQNAKLITRILKPKFRQPPKPKKLFNGIMRILFFVVLVCIVLIILISRTIFKSILEIENATKNIAGGNLEFEVMPEKKRFHDNEIISILKSIDQMRIALLEEQNRKNKFIMGISHDLRTPVAIIKGYTEALVGGMITEKEDLQNTFNLIQNKSNQLEEMINTLINFVKMNQAQLRENLTLHSITQIITNFVNDSEFTANVFKRKIFTNVNFTKDIEVPLNPQLVQRAFENLFNNALRYTKDGDTIEFTANNDEENVYLTIRDTGIGIAQKDLKYIFDMFYRGTNSRKEEGMGIGLSVVKSIIDTHGWTINVDSKKNEGTSFTITIPYNKKN